MCDDSERSKQNHDELEMLSHGFVSVAKERRPGGSLEPMKFDLSLSHRPFRGNPKNYKSRGDFGNKEIATKASKAAAKVRTAKAKKKRKS